MQTTTTKHDMNTQHTPGPWQQGDGYNAHATTVHIKSTLIAKAETEADARLIAAAPDLLAALARAVAWCDEHGDTRHEWYADARAVIANLERVLAA